MRGLRDPIPVPGNDDHGLITGFVGLGDQGGPMAEMILAGGFPVAVWARRGDVRDRFGALGATLAATPRDLAAASDLLCLCVTDDADVRDLLVGQGMLAAMRPATVVAIHSTIRPATCVELNALAQRRGVTLLDMPVSGSGHAALSRTLLVMTGGDARTIARIMPIIECYGGTILRIGEVGSAMQAKLINNLMAIVNIGQAYRALLLGRTMGIDPVALRAALMAGTGRSFAIDLIKRLQAPARAAHVLALLRKDVALAIDATPPEERDYWQALADTGIDALTRLTAGTISLLPERENAHGEYVVHA